MYYRNAAAACVVYDITDVGSFDTLQAWVKELKVVPAAYCEFLTVQQEKGPSGIIIAIVGNKVDLASQRQVRFLPV